MPKRETITATAVRLPDGTTLTGQTHAIAWDNAARSGGLDHYLSKPFAEFNDRVEPWQELEPLMLSSINGFLTASGQFVGREEALKLALTAGQVIGTARRNKLDSDNLPDLESKAIKLVASLLG